MKNKSDLIYKEIESKTITWFSNSNEYLVLENATATILKKLNKGVSINEIATNLAVKLSVPIGSAINFVLDLEKRLKNPKNIIESELNTHHKNVKIPSEFEFVYYYKINNIVFKIGYFGELELSFVHPKFAHLIIENTSKFDYTFEVFIYSSFIYFYIDKQFIGAWNRDEIHYFQGKLSMELIQKIHKKEENKWMGVFHASAVSNGKKSILFLGDSGNGKSTSLALLQANGFTCLADDFVPMDIEKKEIYSFPAAISIKKSSLDTLIPIYPELATTAEYNFKRLNKIVRYLKPNNTNFFAHQPCNEIIFIKYQKDADLVFEKVSKIKAFEQLVPDAWLSPIKENAAIFLDWFSNLTCYQITYSENSKMIHTVTKIFNNEQL